MPRTEPGHLSSYLVESFWPGVTETRVVARTRRAERAAAKLRTEGSEVTYRAAMFVAEDEVAFSLFDASSPATVAEVCRRARLPFDRILEVVQIGALANQELPQQHIRR